MLSKFQSIACLLVVVSCALIRPAISQPLENLATIDFEQADFYLLDVTDHNARVVPSVDAYVHQGDLYLAIVPLFEGLRLKYSIIGDTLSVTYSDTVSEFEFEGVQTSNGQWFNDGSFLFVKAAVLEQLFATKITLNTNSLKMDLAGHKADFPYKTIKNQQKQRKLNNYVMGETEPEKNVSGAVITVKDQYRLATVPTGYASIEYQTNNTDNSYDATFQTESDLAYHSASITLVHDDEETNSRVLLSRYPQFTGDKILGIWDQYSVGDLWLRQSASTSGTSRGLGINFSANTTDNYTENMTTSFAKTARPGWDADIYHNGVFLETRVVPADGLMEFNNLEVYYGSNEFKIVLYGPFGEQDTLFERVDVRSNSLGRGDLSYGLSIKENDSSLLDVDLSEFDIDAIGANISVGLLNNWQLGLTVDFNDIHAPDGGSESYLITNQVTLPGWFFQNNLAINTNSIDQTSSLATSFLNNDSLTLRYNSAWQKGDDNSQLDFSTIEANYNINFDSITNNINYSYDEYGDSKSESFRYLLTFFHKYLNISNAINYNRRDDIDDRFFGSLNITTRINNDLRLVAYIPYDINGDDVFDSEFITASVLYNYRTENYNHSFSASNSSFFKDNLWSLGYNLAYNAPTHQFTLRTQYDSQDNWTVRAGITVNFGYDYFNDAMVFSSKTLRGAGSVDAHAYLDRRLNGIPDVLDYDLPGVTFTGGADWENVTTNKDGRARLFGANNGTTALSANWESGGATLNNDYLIYSHPGSLQRVNLPFYLTTELELFVLLTSGDQTTTLAHVPLVASNLSTGDTYALESDFDGYASFTDLLPGKYQVYVDKEYMAEKGLQAEIGGFEFSSPLKGGFVVLPNIELFRSENGSLGENKLLQVTLDETNYEPLINADNDKLIHLPPKGGMKAPYSSDELDRAVFKTIRMERTEQERKALRSRLTAASESFQQPKQVQQKVNSPVQDVIVEPVQDDSRSLVEEQEEVNQETPSVLPVVEAAQVNTPNSQRADTQAIDLSAGFAVQIAAFGNLDRAINKAQTFTQLEELYIVRKVMDGASFYCLITGVYPDSASARASLKSVDVDGFIVDATKFIEPLWSK